MLPLLSRAAFASAVLLASVLVHLGLLGAMVLAERRALAPAETRTLDVELVAPEQPKQPEPKPFEISTPELLRQARQRIEAASQAASPPASGPQSALQEPPDAATPEPPQQTSDIPPGGAPSEGKSKLTAEEIAALRAQIQKCWQLPVGMPGLLGLDVVIRVAFGPKGQVVGEPDLLKAPASDRGPLLVGIAMRAIKDCMPYRMPATKYADWKVLDLRFTATGMTGLGAAPKLPPKT